MAKTARTALAEALNALQTSADVPDALMEVADPIANAMGILHRIERTQGQDLTGKELALKHVRASLDLLQSFDFSHEALDIVMEKVAGCLTSVHQIARMAAPSAPQATPAPAAPPPAAPAAAPAAAAPAPAQTIKPTQTIPIGQPSPVASAPVPKATPSSPGVARAPTPAPQGYVPLPIPPPPAPTGGVGIHGTQMMAEPSAPSPARDPNQDSTFPLSRPAPSGPQLSVREISQPISQQAFQPAPAFPPASTAPRPTPQPASAPIGITAPIHQSLGATAPFNQSQPQSYGQPQVAQSTVAQGPSSGRPSASVQPAPTSQARPSQRSSTKSSPEVQGNVVAELGAHSASNFYKGLGGNDVIEHGGLFVATYRIPKIGTTVMLRVLLPGDYEFTASGTVQWTREPSEGNDSFDPGFGARFTQITPEGRQLVYRYTRNREPMFYDDL